jgi:hypothetical protein
MSGYMNDETSLRCRFSGRSFVQSFGGARRCSDALDAMCGITVPVGTVEKWQERDRLPSWVLAAAVNADMPVDIRALVVCTP